MNMEKKTIVTINGNGTMSVPDKVMMQDFEIAELFGVMISTIKSNIRTILKTGIATSDCTNGATLVGNNILPDYHGLDMVVALAFRIQSPQTEIFRRWILTKATERGQNIASQIFIAMSNKRSSKTLN